MAVYRRVYDSRHLQADCQELQLRNSTLGDRAWATFTLFIPWFETEIVLERVFNWQFFSVSLFGPLI